MKLARSRDGRSGVVVTIANELRVVDVFANLESLERSDPEAGAVLSSLFPRERSGWQPLIADWVTAGPALTSLAALVEDAGPQGIAMTESLSDFALGPPLISRSGRIFAAGANYADHAARAFAALVGSERTEQAISEERSVQHLPPWGFIVVSDCVIGDGGEVTPPASTEKLDYEAEIAVVLTTGGRDLNPADVRFWGAAPWNDFSLRDPHLGIGPAIDRGVLVWALQKNFQSGSAFGPWLTIDPATEYDDIEFELFVNDDRRQSSSTAGMIYPYAEIAAHLSEYIELKPGDIITSGTPAGTAIEGGINGKFLQDGDIVRVTSPQLGTLTNVVRRSPAV
jgi:2-keto-4-pentenoate hydratase/2-oxohepta-3-ene-1,7-dioic acid hydratase in catechol pathway